jgi:hypothetical protein
MADKDREPVITDFTKREQTRLLLVEGKDDAAFVFGLMTYLGLKDDIFVYAVKGKDKFARSLRVLIKSPEFTDLEYIGIIRDRDFAEDDPNPFARLRHALERASASHQTHEYPVPDEEQQPASNEDLTVNILLLPEKGLEGMLEDLIFGVFQDDVVTDCVEDYFTCLEDKTGDLRRNIVPKARLRAFIAGKAVDARNTKNDTEIWEPDLIYNRASWWQDDYWNHESFDAIKTFLRQMVE